jgi:hypothetical protein
MVQDHAANAAAEEGSVWLRPWRVLLIGLGAVVVGSGLMAYDGTVVTPMRLLLMVAGLIAGGWAVQRRLTTAGDDLDERVESAGLVAVYSFSGLVGFLGMADAWFSGRIFFGFFIAGTILGSLLLLLPRLWRRLVATLLILVHFGGIVVATTCIPATNGQSPWLPTMLYVKFYRPYLSGLYLTNAYHFYAPDPGASTLVWICIQYDDDQHTCRWLKMPNRTDSETPLHYQREMGMCEATSVPSLEMQMLMQNPGEFQERYRHRVEVGELLHIPLRNDRMPQGQYYAPDDYSKAIMSSMARHAWRFYPHPTNPAIAVKSVKIYRLSYTIIMPPALLQGQDPLSDDLKLPFFMGDYDSEGRLTNAEDPFLNWVVPMKYLHAHAGDGQAVTKEEVQLP